MILRALVFVVAVGTLLAACGPPALTEEQICGPSGCDECIGFGCPSADGGVR